MKIVQPEAVTTTTLTASNVTESETAWSAVTSYSTTNVVKRLKDGINRRYSSLINSNLNNDPATDDGTKWLDEGPTNRYAMFDQYLQGQTSNADSIEVTIDAAGSIDVVALLNVEALSATVVVTHDTEGEVYNETVSLISDEGIDDWWPYFTEEIDLKRDVILTDLPGLYFSPDIDITLDYAGGTAKCGTCIIGSARDIGGAQYGASVGIKDYSVKSEDDFGNLTIVERAYRDTADFQIVVQNTRFDWLKRLLASVRATPRLYIGADDYAATAIYGYWTDFRQEIPHPAFTICTLQLASLT